MALQSVCNCKIQLTRGRFTLLPLVVLHLGLLVQCTWTGMKSEDPDTSSLFPLQMMPYCFRRHYGLRVTSIIDCFKLFIEKPSNRYKGWGGQISDKYITEHSLMWFWLTVDLMSIPVFTRGCDQLKLRTRANVRIDVERVIRAVHPSYWLLE